MRKPERIVSKLQRYCVECGNKRRHGSNLCESCFKEKLKKKLEEEK